MNTNNYLHVAEVMRATHDALVSWSRGILQQANLETVEVYGQFPPQGLVSSHLVVFPYWVGPSPKLLDTAGGLSIVHPVANAGDGKISFIPDGWMDLGAQLAEHWSVLFPNAGTPQVGSRPAPFPFPLVEDLPKPLRDWFMDRLDEDGDPWMTKVHSKLYARPPAITWRPGFTLSVRYVCVASDPGRGTSQQTSVHAPLALPALSVMAAGIHHERTIKVVLPPPPLPSLMISLVEALTASLEGEAAEKLEETFELLKHHHEIKVALLPVHDLSNQEFALLMQALQRPLQAALNMQLRLTLGARPGFGPSSFTRFKSPTQANRGGLKERR